MIAIETNKNQIVYTEEKGFEYGDNKIICSEFLAPIISLLNRKGYFVTEATGIHYANKKYYINYDGEKRVINNKCRTKVLTPPSITFANEIRRRLYPYFSTLPDPWVCIFEDGLMDDYTILSKEMIATGKWASLRGFEFIDDDLYTMTIAVENYIWIDKSNIYEAYAKLTEMCGALYNWVQSLPYFPDETYSIMLNKEMYLSWAVNFDMYNPEKPAGVTFLTTEQIDDYKKELDAKLASFQQNPPQS